MALIGEEAINFRSAGITCRGVLRLPDPTISRGQTVILCPGLGGTQDGPVIKRAVCSFSAAGFNTFSFDYRSFGASDGHPRQVASVADQLHDIKAAISALSHQSTIDANQLILWGNSLGGAHAIVSATATGTCAVIAQMPFVGLTGRPQAKDAARFGGRIASDRVRQALRLPPHYIPLVASPGRVAAMSTVDADTVINSFHGTSWNNKVAARVLLDLKRYQPVEHVGATPLLVCVGENDPHTPRELVDILVDTAPNCELKVLSIDHFGQNGTASHDELANAQIDFLRRVLH